MLPPFIIEQIRKREEEERRRDHRPVLELPLPSAPASHSVPSRKGREEEEAERGVFIIDLMN